MLHRPTTHTSGAQERKEKQPATHLPPSGNVFLFRKSLSRAPEQQIASDLTYFLRNSSLSLRYPRAYLYHTNTLQLIRRSSASWLMQATSDVPVGVLLRLDDDML